MKIEQTIITSLDEALARERITKFMISINYRNLSNAPILIFQRGSLLYDLIYFSGIQIYPHNRKTKVSIEIVRNNNQLEIFISYEILTLGNLGKKEMTTFLNAELEDLKAAIIGTKSVQLKSKIVEQSIVNKYIIFISILAMIALIVYISGEIFYRYSIPKFIIFFFSLILVIIAVGTIYKYLIQSKNK